MPTSVEDGEAGQYQVLSIDKSTHNSTADKVGQDRKKAINFFKNMTAQPSEGKLAVLVDPSGRAIKFSEKNKPELFSDLADFVQGNGDSTTPVMREDLAGFDLLPPGQRPDSRRGRQPRQPDPLPEVGDLHRRSKSTK